MAQHTEIVDAIRKEPDDVETATVLSKSQKKWKREWYIDWIKYRTQERKDKISKEMLSKFYDFNADHSHFIMKVHYSRLRSSLGALECSICYDDLRTKNPRQLPCGHMFHLECLKSNFAKRENGDNCPFCKREWKVFRVPEWEYPRYKYFNQKVPGERQRLIRVQVGGFRDFSMDLNPYERRYWGEVPGELGDFTDWVMGDAPNAEQNMSIPPYKEYVWKPAGSRTVLQQPIYDSNKIIGSDQVAKTTTDWADDVEEAIEKGDLPDFTLQNNIATSRLLQEDCSTILLGSSSSGFQEWLSKVRRPNNVKDKKPAADNSQLVNTHFTQTPLPTLAQSLPTKKLRQRNEKPPPKPPTPKSVGLQDSRWAWPPKVGP